jgi:ABC-type antimicrobial peptide transport system permease subunit
MLSVSFKLANSNLIYRKERTLLTIFSIAISIFISFLLLSIIDGFLKTIGNSLNLKKIDIIVSSGELPIELGPIVISTNSFKIDNNIYQELNQKYPNFIISPVFKNLTKINNKLIPIISLNLKYLDKFYPNFYVNILSTEDIVLIGEKLAKILNLKENDNIIIQNKIFKVYKILNKINGYEDYSIFLDYKEYTKLFNVNNLSQLWIITNLNNLESKKIIQRLKNDYPNLSFYENEEINSNQYSLIAILKSLQVIIIVASVSTALVASTNTILITTFERIKEFAILLAIGSPRALIFLSVLFEGIIISFIGSIIGIILGIISSILFQNSFYKAINLSIPIVSISANVFLQILIITFLIGILSSILPAYISSTINLQESIKK